MKILGTGLTGLVGSRIVELLSSKYKFDDLSRESGVDITNKEDLFRKIKDSNASLVLHLAAKTDVDECEKDRVLGKNGEAWKVNVEGTRNIVDACGLAKKRLIYISTDFVFFGKKQGPYIENDKPAPLSWYGQTKYEGEKIVQNSNLLWIIARISYPYRASFKKNDFARSIILKLQRGEKITAITDHVMTPTFIDDITGALETLVLKNKTGIFHLVGSQFVSPFDAAIEIADIFSFDKSLIKESTRSEYFKGKAQRPFNLFLNNDKIQKLGVKMRGFEEGLYEVKKQMESL